MLVNTARFVLCLLVLGAAGCGGPEPEWVFPSATRTGAPTLPAYPRSLGQPTVVVQETDGQPAQWPRQQITFQTRDTPQEVRTFYKEQLTQQGWHVVQELDQVLQLSAIEACPYYDLDIRATQTTTMLTSVELDLSPVECEHGRY